MTHPILILSCEHATNLVPKAYRNVFTTRNIPSHWNLATVPNVLKEHWGYDIGAKALATLISAALRNHLTSFPVSRLLIEGNRYRNTSLFSAFSKNLPKKIRAEIKHRYWKPHIETLETRIRKAITRKTYALHIGIHSFTPVRNGVVRNGDIGILFDPQRPKEKIIARKLQKSLQTEFPDLRVRRNYPYTGYSEGLTKLFRKKTSPSRYCGVEIEINNKHLRSPAGQKFIATGVSRAIKKIIV